MLKNLEEIGFFPEIEIIFEHEAIDIRNYVITDVVISNSIEIQLEFEGRKLYMKFTNAVIIEGTSTTAGMLMGGWLLSISKAQYWTWEGKDILTFSLDFAVIEGWLVSCSSATALLTPAPASVPSQP
jgi:hypothetical protein